MRALELAQHVQLHLGIAPDIVELTLQGTLELLPVEAIGRLAGVEQGFQQHRVAGDLLGDPGAGGQVLNQFFQQRPVLVEQLVVDAATGNGLE